LVKNPDCSFSIVSKFNGKFISIEPENKSLITVSKRINKKWECFIIEENPDGSFALKSQANMLYIGVDHTNEMKLMSHGTKISIGESFILSINPTVL
jgi:hypothetical protein